MAYLLERLDDARLDPLLLRPVPAADFVPEALLRLMPLALARSLGALPALLVLALLVLLVADALRPVEDADGDLDMEEDEEVRDAIACS